MGDVVSPRSLAYAHLLLRLRPINRLLADAVGRQQRAARRYAKSDLASLNVTDKQVGVLLDNIDLRCSGTGSSSRAVSDTTVEEGSLEQALRDRATDIGCVLPLDSLQQELGLSVFETNALLICAAPEIESSYRRVYAYILDDARRHAGCRELLVELLATSHSQRAEFIVVFGPNGKLRRYGLLRDVGTGNGHFPPDLRVANAALEQLLGTGTGWQRRFGDPEVVDKADAGGRIGPADDRIAKKIGRALRQRQVDLAAVWGAKGTNVDAVVRAAAGYSGRSLRLLTIATGADAGIDVFAIRSSLARASAAGSILWLQTDPLRDLEYAHWGPQVERLVQRSDVPIIISGEFAWRPTELMSKKNFLECSLESTTHEDRATSWRREMPELSADTAATLATRYRFNVDEVAAAARTARVHSRVESNGSVVPADRFIDKACATVARRQSSKFATLIEPRRSLSDLILPPRIHRQIAEVARFYKSLHRVDEEWGFGRLVTGGGGSKVLLAGDSGCGKTLAVEAIAHDIGIPVMKCEVAQLVSKWVGETEKNLEAVFREAEESHVVLFFDEADVLFGKRGSIDSGTDRWANLEVGFLLQTLESYCGLVIAASNMTDSIDPAFSRRFQVIVHFPRPGVDERRKIWQIALPPRAPVADDIDFEALTRWDMTGAAIVNAARSAALYAADQGAAKIDMEHIVFAITQQYQREARVISPSELGRYADYAIQEP